MSLSKSILAPRRLCALLAFVGLACASSGSSGGGADSADPEAEDEDALDCSALQACGDKLDCSGEARCFKLKSCPEFVCVSVKQACKAECGAGNDCLLLESQPLLMGCK
ncbi:MAG TPA: hypothetical protein VM686_41265 [Polyangiaceae bacterium]|jgi:hypothetical protein|nr:hypothetical protein [Polyangiaceae bacterium]